MDKAGASVALRAPLGQKGPGPDREALGHPSVCLGRAPALEATRVLEPARAALLLLAVSHLAPSSPFIPHSDPVREVELVRFHRFSHHTRRCDRPAQEVPEPGKDGEPVGAVPGRLALGPLSPGTAS